MAGRQQQMRQEERPPQAQPRKKKRVRRFYNYSLLFTVLRSSVFRPSALSVISPL